MSRYRGNRNDVQLGAYQMRKGELIPDEVIRQIPSGRFGSLVRTGIILEVVSDDELATLPVGEVGERCPECGDGPFKRLEQHISMKHAPEPVEAGPTTGGTGSLTGDLTVE